MFRLIVIIILTFSLAPGISASEIRVSISADMRSSYPGVKRDGYSDDVLTQVVEGLLAYRSDLTIGPMAAASYHVSDDLTEYRFELREGMLFHNGDQVRAEHLKFNWDKILEPETGFQCLPFYDGTIGPKIIEVTAPDDLTLIIKWDQPNAVFPEMLADVKCPVAILHPDSWDENGEWVAPIATGPFKLSDWRPGRYILLEKFEEYVASEDPTTGLVGRKEALVDRVRFDVIPETLAQNAALVSGQIDIVYSATPLTAMEMNRNRGMTVETSPGLSRRLLLMQTDDPVLSDPKIRQAIGHALNLDLFAEIASFGSAPSNPSVLPAVNPLYSAAHTQWYEYDPDRARMLLRQTGYNNEPIHIQTSKSFPELFDLAMIADAMLREVGFNVKVDVMEWGAMMSNYSAGSFQVLAFEYSPRITAFMSYNSAVGQKTDFPYIWENEEAFSLLKSAVAERDADKARDIYEQIHLMMVADIPSINIYYVPVTDITGRHVRGYTPWPGMKPRLWNVWMEED